MKWLTDYEEALREARHQHRPILMQFEKEGCLGCHKLYTTTYVHPAVQEELRQWFVLLKQHIRKDRKVRANYAAVWTPSLYFLDSRGKAYYDIAGYLNVEDFRVVLRYGLARIQIPRGQYTEAIQHLEDGLHRWPDNPRASSLLYWRIIADYLKTWDQQRMRMQFEELRRRYPESAEARMWPYLD